MPCLLPNICLVSFPVLPPCIFKDFKKKYKFFFHIWTEYFHQFFPFSFRRRFSPENSNIAVNGPFKHSNFWPMSFFGDDSNRNFVTDTFQRLTNFAKKKCFWKKWVELLRYIFYIYKNIYKILPLLASSASSVLPGEWWVTTLPFWNARKCVKTLLILPFY